MTLPIIDFLVVRLQEYDPKFELRSGTAYYELFVKPLEIIVQPFSIELDNIKLNQSLRRIAELPYPDAHPEDAVDSLISNVFVDRITGGKAAGSARAYYYEPVDVIYPKDGLEFTSSAGLIYRNNVALNVSATVMSGYVDRELFYVDVPIVAAETGDAYNLTAADMIIGVSDSRAVTASNPDEVLGGIPRETNTDYIARAKKSIAVRDMNTGKGFNAIMFESFPDTLAELQAVGFLDPEMRRDIVYNVHIGGRIDGYVKTNSISTKVFDVIGLLVDETRRITTTSYTYMVGNDWIGLRAPNIDTTDHAVVVESTNTPTKAVFYSYANLSSPVDLSAGSRIGMSIDNYSHVNFTIAGVVPATTYINEIISRINNVFHLPIASAVINPEIKTTTTTGVCVASINRFYDPTPYAFQNVGVGDTLFIYDGVIQTAYTVLSRVNSNTISVNATLSTSLTNVKYRITRTGTFIKIVTELAMYLLSTPLSFGALNIAFGIPSEELIQGTQTVVYNEHVGYEVNYTNANIKRLIGPTVVTEKDTGTASIGIYFTDTIAVNPFAFVEPGDVLSIVSALNMTLVKDYRILEVISPMTLRLDRPIEVAESDVIYEVTRSEILDGESVSITFDYNTLSIDVGGLIPLDVYGRTRGVRPGRELQTITDTPLLDVIQVELIDPVTLEPLNQILEARSGFGIGGFGRGGFGRGGSSEWRLQVLDPTTRFSVWENSLIIIDPAYSAQSFRVTYRSCPIISSYQSFADSDLERVLDAHILFKHFLPAYVNADIYYSIDPNNPSTPTNDAIVVAVKSFINTMDAASALDMSDIVQLILSMVDPTVSGKARVKLPCTMKAVIHNSNGTRTMLSSSDQLIIEDNTVDEPDTVAPLTPRISHWIADNINLVRI